MRCFHEMPFGATLLDSGTCRFRLWAPTARAVTLRLHGTAQPMESEGAGWWSCHTQAQAGDTYLFAIDDQWVVPDPASRAQAEDVHGASVVVDPSRFAWDDHLWRGRPWQETVIYELHVGTFTDAGTFRAVIDRLPALVDLGITAIELMPVAEFPGRYDWGYDGVLLFAPERHYGSPDQLKELIAAAHRSGLMVFLDVVYNHFGPEGNYLHLYAPEFFTQRHHTPWGAAIQFDGVGSRVVRDFFIHNALYWLEEFHFDGLRLDAVHAIFDASTPDILTELGATVRERFAERQIHLILENDNNAAHYLRPPTGAFSAQWNDDFHHALHVIATGEEGGYYEDFALAPHQLFARSLREGFAFQGDYSNHRKHPRGEQSGNLPVTAFINFIQNHDQVGNRAHGERLTTLTSPEALMAMTTVLLLAPAPPLLFMGQEWGSEQPFPFFCDFGEELASKVTEGRRREFSCFPEFSHHTNRTLIPDPQAAETIASAKLRWQEANTATGRAWRDFHRELLHLRREEIVPRLAGVTNRDAKALVVAEGVIAASWRLRDRMLFLLANLCAEPAADLSGPGEPLFATPNAFSENGTLAPWGVAWFLAMPGEGTLRLNGEPVLP